MRKKRAEQIAAIATVLVRNPDRAHSAYELTDLAGLRLGTIHAILCRWEVHGWLSSGWYAPITEAGPRRRCYVLTEAGRRALGPLVPAGTNRVNIKITITPEVADAWVGAFDRMTALMERLLERLPEPAPKHPDFPGYCDDNQCKTCGGPAGEVRDAQRFHPTRRDLDRMEGP